MGKTTIGWCNYSLNFYTWACKKVSPGCKNCYMFRIANDHKKIVYPVPEWREAALDELRAIKGGNTVFVNDMSDTFNEGVSLPVIKRLFQHLNQRPDLIFLLLTKRPQIAQLVAHELKWTDNIWLGVSVESSAYMHRVDVLKHIPVAHRFISFEPLLEYIPQTQVGLMLEDHSIDWLIVGGESGEYYRPFSKEWASDIQQVAARLKIPFYFKQGSAQFPDSDRILNGRTYDEFPQAFADLEDKYAVKVTQSALF